MKTDQEAQAYLAETYLKQKLKPCDKVVVARHVDGSSFAWTNAYLEEAGDYYFIFSKYHAFIYYRKTAMVQCEQIEMEDWLRRKK